MSSGPSNPGDPVSLAALSPKKARELGFLKVMLRHLGIVADTIEPTEAGADALVTMDGSRIAIEVTGPYVVDDGDSPQARAARWPRFRDALTLELRKAGILGMLFVEFRMRAGWPDMPPSREFSKLIAEILAEAKRWYGATGKVTQPKTSSALVASVSALKFHPGRILDVASNHLASFLPQISEELIVRAIRTKVSKPQPEADQRWLLIVTGSDLHQPTAGIAIPPVPFTEEPDPDRTFHRIFLLDLVPGSLYEKQGLFWIRPTGVRGPQEAQ